MARRKKTKEELEELTRTQVLNLQELEKAANFEKRTSKKPAAILAIIGLLSISLGISYPGINTMLSDKPITEKKVSVSEKREELNITNNSVQESNELTCTASVANTDATVTTVTYNFQFQSTGMLGFYTKTMDIKASAPLTQTPVSIISLDTSLANLMQTPINGYLIEKNPVASTTPNVVDGYTAKLSVDMTVFNPATLTALHTSNSFANVEFSASETKDIIKPRVESLGYTCK